MYKEYDSEIINRVRARVEQRTGNLRFHAFDPDEDLQRIVYSRPTRRTECTAYLLSLDERRCGYSDGGTGEESDSVCVYQLTAFPGMDINYEWISYRYNRDKIFLFREGRLAGHLKGGFESRLDQVEEWELYLNDRLIGAMNVNAAMLRDKRLAFHFSGDSREPVFLPLEPPPPYNDLPSALLYFMNTYLLFSHPPGNDRVLAEDISFAPTAEVELLFHAFVFFRTMVFR